MIEIVALALLFVLSLMANAVIIKWSTKRVLGLDISVMSSYLVVMGRSLAALLAGFAIGYAVRLGLLTENNDQIEYVKIAAMLLVACLSFLAYWILLGKASKTSISFWGVTKTVATETVMLAISVVGVSVVLSTVFFLFS